MQRTLPSTCSSDSGTSLLSPRGPQGSTGALHMEGSWCFSEQRGGPQMTMGGDDKVVMKQRGLVRALLSAPESGFEWSEFS